MLQANAEMLQQRNEAKLRQTESEHQRALLRDEISTLKVPVVTAYRWQRSLLRFAGCHPFHLPQNLYKWNMTVHLAIQCRQTALQVSCSRLLFVAHAHVRVMQVLAQHCNSEPCSGVFRLLGSVYSIDM